MKKFLLVLMMVFVTISTSFAKGYVKPLNEKTLWGWEPLYEHPMWNTNYNMEKDTESWYTKEIADRVGAENGFKFIPQGLPENSNFYSYSDKMLHNWIGWYKETEYAIGIAEKNEGWVGGQLAFRLYTSDENGVPMKYPEIVNISFIYNIYSDTYKTFIRCYTF